MTGGSQSGRVVGVASNLGGLRQGDRIRGRREAPGAVVASKGVHKAAECYVKINFGDGKGVALEIRQALRGRRRQGYIGVRRRDRVRWVSECWYGYRGCPGGRIIMCCETTE